MSYSATITWPYPAAQKVILTGSFDHWSCSFPMTRTNEGFTATVQVPYGSKVYYKFIVDGQWLTGNNAPTEWDNRGNLNNWFIAPAAPPAPVPSLEAYVPGSQLEEAKPEPVPEPAPAPTIVPAVVNNLVDTIKNAVAAAVGTEASAPEPKQDSILGEPVLVTSPEDLEAIIPPKDVPAVEEVKPVEKPTSEATGTGLGADAAAAREVLEHLEAEEEKVVPEKIATPAIEEPKPVEEPVQLPAPVKEPVVAAPVSPAPVVPQPAPEPKPAEPVKEALRPATPPARAPAVVDLSAPAKTPVQSPARPSKDTSSSSSGSSSDKDKADKNKTFPTAGSPPASPSKASKKEEGRKKRTSLLKRIKHVFSSKD